MVKIERVNQKMDKIRYEDAAILLGTSSNVLKQAIHRGIFTPFPREGRYSYLAKEQVLLFVGKSQLSISLLSDNEKVIWERIRNEIAKLTPITSTLTYSSPEIDYDKLAERLQIAMLEKEIADKQTLLQEKKTDVPYQNIDKAVEVARTTDDSDTIAMLIIGLLIVFGVALLLRSKEVKEAVQNEAVKGRIIEMKPRVPVPASDINRLLNMAV